MTISTYINKIKNTKKISYKQLSEEMKIGYPNLVALKNNSESLPSMNVLSILSNYLNKSRVQVLFEILEEDVGAKYSKASLLKLCEMYLDGFAIQFNSQMINPFSNGYLTFDGTAYKKRTGYKFTIIESWSHLKQEHWSLFVNLSNEQEKIEWYKVFKSYDSYIVNVLYYAIYKINKCEYKNLTDFVIVIDNEEEYEVKIIEKHIPKKLSMNLKIERKCTGFF